MKRRGWSEASINDTIQHPYAVREATNRATGNPATAYFAEDGSYVMRDNITGDIIQISDKTRPWVPDSSINDPYIPEH